MNCACVVYMTDRDVCRREDVVVVNGHAEGR